MTSVHYMHIPLTKKKEEEFQVIYNYYNIDKISPLKFSNKRESGF